MWVCHCNAITDHQIDTAIQRLWDENGEKPEISLLYKEVSGGRKPNCGTCIQEFQKRVEQIEGDQMDERDMNGSKDTKSRGRHSPFDFRLPAL